MQKKWTNSRLPNLSGKTMIVTSGDSSLGYETVKAFAMNGGLTILACRNLAMGERIKSRIAALHPGAAIEVMPLDLRDPKSIKQFSETFLQNHERLDLLVNTGCTHLIPAGESATLFGSHLGSDQAGHFLLTTLLLPKLAATPRSRVVNMSLGEHKLKNRDFDRMLSKRGHRNTQKHRIGSSRWTNMVFTYELQKFFDTQKVDCKAVAAYPGPANRNLERSLRNHWTWKVFKPVFKMFTGPDSPKTAAPCIQAALSDMVKGGEYFGPDGFIESNGYPSYNAVLHFVA